MWRIELAEATALMTHFFDIDSMFIWRSQVEDILCHGASKLRERHNIMKFVAGQLDLKDLKTYQDSDQLRGKVTEEDAETAPNEHKEQNWSGSDGVYHAPELEDGDLNIQ